MERWVQFLRTSAKTQGDPMKRFALILALALVFAGCGKKVAPTPIPQDPPSQDGGGSR